MRFNAPGFAHDHPNSNHFIQPRNTPVRRMISKAKQQFGALASRRYGNPDTRNTIASVARSMRRQARNASVKRMIAGGKQSFKAFAVKGRPGSADTRRTIADKARSMRHGGQ